MQKRSIAMMLIVFLCSATLVFAADQNRDRTRDQKKDGSCKLTERAFDPLLAADQSRTRDKKKDGSCKLTEKGFDPLLAADQTRDRKQDRKRDGSCQG